ncbi:hypothetical protein HELRODRAFT_87300 [Helobdella robusta]|uniref:UDENN domain-containing protein n=1 Tax=Helobdella robusta TaxID=6412 RepID=T1G6N9_HELRO|nr:hypothetical protein HELRODRAFT_87300 [Helobdella robusta]ESN94997.1 hypothetical protein HELRODRAFT_87300 [Helobdella robusta]
MTSITTLPLTTTSTKTTTAPDKTLTSTTTTSFTNASATTTTTTSTYTSTITSTTTTSITLKSNSNNNTNLPWDRFHNWIHCICIVTFDLELGQAMEMIYPSHAKLTEKEKLSICYLSFPDSNSGCTGDTKFHFRIRRCPTSKQNFSYFHQFNRHCPTALQVDCNYLYGYVYFRQMKDRTIRRGYFQKSVVIISRFQFVNFFTCLNDILAPQFFDVGIPSLEAACHNIDQWSPPNPGQTLNLPIAGSIIQTRVPCRSDKLINTTTLSSVEPQVILIDCPNVFIPSVYEVDSYNCFLQILSHVQLLWELVLICEPLVVMAAQPSTSSTVVHALISLIWPVRYACDFRPFFTIHDSEFREYTSSSQIPPSVILGVTNPFFAKTLQHWPHIIRVGDASEGWWGGGWVVCWKVKSHKSLDVYPGLYTRYVPFLKRDKTFLKKLMKGLSVLFSPSSLSLPSSSSLSSPPSSSSLPSSSPPPSSPPLTSSSSPSPPPPTAIIVIIFITIICIIIIITTSITIIIIDTTRKFFSTPNFECWLRHREREVNQKLKMLHLEALCSCNLEEWLKGKKEVQKVDLIIRMNENLVV